MIESSFASFAYNDGALICDAARAQSRNFACNSPSRSGSWALPRANMPDTGTDQLAGLSGLMKIINENGQHSYVFEYALA